MQEDKQGQEMTVDEQLETEYQGFVVDSDGAADWAMQKIAEAQRDKERWKAHYDREYGKVEAKAQGTIDFFTFHLSKYFQQVPHRETKTMHKYILPSGELLLKINQGKATADSAELLKWLRDNDMRNYIKPGEPSPMWGELKKQCVLQPDGTYILKETGEVVQGVKVSPLPDTFVAKVKGGTSDGNEQA